MKRLRIVVATSVLLLAGCRQSTRHVTQPTAYGAQIVEVSGGKQWAQVGATLPQPLILQVNGADGNPVTGVLVALHGDGLQFNPEHALTDSNGQVSVMVQLGFNSGDYEVTAKTPKSGGGSSTLALREIALGYEQALGEAVNDKYCIRCHDAESTPERVSNFDNLSPAPHQFSDGATLNRLTDADLVNMIAHGGLALGKSPQMPAFAATLKPSEINAVLSYIRTIADPPYQTPGVKYGK